MSQKYYKICPECSFFCNAKEPDEYCSLCGSELIDRCPNCAGTLENPYARFCKYCGSKLPGRSVIQNQEVKNF